VCGEGGERSVQMIAADQLGRLTLAESSPRGRAVGPRKGKPRCWWAAALVASPRSRCSPSPRAPSTRSDSRLSSGPRTHSITCARCSQATSSPALPGYTRREVNQEVRLAATRAGARLRLLDTRVLELSGLRTKD
jgi:hypothetical protein